MKQVCRDAMTSILSIEADPSLRYGSGGTCRDLHLGQTLEDAGHNLLNAPNVRGSMVSEKMRSEEEPSQRPIQRAPDPKFDLSFPLSFTPRLS